MATFVRDPEPIEIEELRERRERLGLDHHDEVWEGVLHMNPPPSTEHQSLLQQLAVLFDPLARDAGLVPLIQVFGLGEDRHNYRSPAGGLFRTQPHGVWQTTAALVIEVVSPDDRTWQKLDYYADHAVEELLILDPRERRVHWFALREGEYRPVERSALIEHGAAEHDQRLVWP
ncbi:MAG TPA: Uma2 family endonuclease [Solirubrobacteraceae bacterium]|nr:Uma2 family endonuclease [Solirubrobacteraceae bacterium]